MSYIKFTKTSTNSTHVFEQYLTGKITKEEYARTEIYFRSEKIAVYYEEKDSIQHKTWFKTILNPIMRLLGWTIVSHFKQGKFVGYRVRAYPQNCIVTLMPMEDSHADKTIP